MIIELLKNVPLFQELDLDALKTISECVELIELSKGSVLFHEGDEGSHTYIIKQGEVEITRESSGREVLLALQNRGSVIGEMALLESMPRNATVSARTDTKLYSLHKDDFNQLMNSNPSVMQTMFRSILSRLRDNQVNLQQSEKMAQLGTLTAGIAHELNNPAAAVKRSSEKLIEAIKNLDGSYGHISHLGFDDSQWEILNSLVGKVINIAYSPPEMDALTRSDMEAEIENWLVSHGIEKPWQIAPNLVNLQFSDDDMTSFAENFPEEKLLCVIEWLNATYDVYSLLNEISQASSQISGIVKSLKSYVYLDQAEIQAVDINEGLDNTLTILNNKLKYGINVKRVYTEDLPEVMGYGSELNQVWTNLIDNAADVLSDQEDGKIIIRTREDNGRVFVEIEDNGPGIPEEIQPRIFDAFFTTKELGKGTGLGLNISYNIVVQKHRGDIRVTSKPGKTCFEVLLPLNMEE